MQEKLSFSGGRSHTVLDKQRGRAETYAMCKERRAQRFVGLAVDLGCGTDVWREARSRAELKLCVTPAARLCPGTKQTHMQNNSTHVAFSPCHCMVWALMPKGQGRRCGCCGGSYCR